jgi:ATPase subunit of ABC transporter with duplicated ATPase domains
MHVYYAYSKQVQVLPSSMPQRLGEHVPALTVSDFLCEQTPLLQTLQYASHHCFLGLRAMEMGVPMMVMSDGQRARFALAVLTVAPYMQKLVLLPAGGAELRS